VYCTAPDLGIRVSKGIVAGSSPMERGSAI
jgi:hypothetical protein